MLIERIKFRRKNQFIRSYNFSLAAHSSVWHCPLWGRVNNEFTNQRGKTSHTKLLCTIRTAVAASAHRRQPSRPIICNFCFSFGISYKQKAISNANRWRNPKSSNSKFNASLCFLLNSFVIFHSVILFIWHLHTHTHKHYGWVHRKVKKKKQKTFRIFLF